MATFNVDGLNTTLSFEYTATTAKIQDLIGDCSEALFDRGRGDRGTEKAPIVFADLTNQDKLDIVDDYIKDVIVNMANAKKLSKIKDEVSITEYEL